MKKALMLALPVILLSVGTAAAQDNKCEAAVKDALDNAGVKWSSLSNIQWDTDTWNSGRGTSEPTVSGYQFYAEPSSCTGGGVVVDINNLCQVSNMRTHGDCKIKGVPHWWW